MRPLLDLEYVLPLKSEGRVDPSELVSYAAFVSEIADVTIVDGSPDDVFNRHREIFPARVRHMRTDPRGVPGVNGKVTNVMIGVIASRHERIVLADDDVRYGHADLLRIAALLENNAVVRPQNYFAPQPWHARWDTSRSLINRAFSADYPGTLGVRRSLLMHTNGYRADVLFENLELIRTVRASGEQEFLASDLFIKRRPSDLLQFIAQRVRQSYDSFAQPGRLLGEMSILPALYATSMMPISAPLPFVAAIVVAEIGRRRHAGTSVYPASAALWAPFWLVERGVCVWVAALMRLCGGMPYSGHRIRDAGSSVRAIKARNTRIESGTPVLKE